LTSWTSRASVTGLAVLGHIEVENLTTIVTEHEVHVEHVEHAEPDGWNGEEIHRCNTGAADGSQEPDHIGPICPLMTLVFVKSRPISGITVGAVRIESKTDAVNPHVKR
jgi:hypothetical protein